MTQNALDQIIMDNQKNPQLTAYKLVQDLHAGQMQVVAMRLDGVVVPFGFGLVMPRRVFKNPTKKSKISEDMKLLVPELHLMGLELYAIDYSDSSLAKRY